MAITLTDKQLFQVRPSGTSATLALGPSARTHVKWIQIANTSGSAAVASLYHDDDGTTYDETTALVPSLTIPGGGFALCDWAGLGISIANGGKLAVKTSVANALTFTGYGPEES